MSVENECIIVSVSVQLPGYIKVAKKETIELCDNKKASVDSVGVKKNIFGSHESYNAIRNHIASTKTDLYKSSLPWGDRTGERLVHKTKWSYVENLLNAAELEFNRLVDDFLKNYEKEIIPHAKSKLGDMFDPSEYPSLSEMKKEFKWHNGGARVPDPHDMRTVLGLAEEDKFRKKVEAEHNRKIEIAVSDTVEKIETATSRLLDRMESYRVVEENGKKKVHGKFKDATLRNMKDISDLLKTMNITNNPDIEKIRSVINDKISRWDSKELREDSGKREVVAKDAREILKIVKGVTANE